MHAGHLKVSAQRRKVSYLSQALTVLTIKTAAAKGLVAGRFIIRREDGTQTDGMDDKEVWRLTIPYFSD